MQGIDRQYEYEARRERERDFEAELARGETRKAERVAEDAYLERSRASYLSGESEEVFELREAAAIAEGYRVTERANAAVLQALGLGRIGNGLFVRVGTRRAA